MSNEQTEQEIIELERAALDCWARGDPYGFLGDAADDVTYFDHMTAHRMDGLAAVKEHLKIFVGTVDVKRHELVNPQVRLFGEIAVLTLNWHTFTADGEPESRWNATEVYQRTGETWQRLHVQWALQPAS